MRIARLCGALCAGLLMACDFVASQPGSQDSAAPAKASAEVVIPEPPPAAIVKAPTTEELLRSCPLEGVAFADLRKHLDQGEFAKVDAILETLFQGHRKTPACEAHLWNAMGFLSSVDLPLLDRWAAARPDSWGVFTARGIHWIEAGYKSRGGAFSKDVTEAQWAGMREAFARAESDLMRALEIEPDGYPAYGYAIYMLKSKGDPSEIRKWLDALLARDPLNYGVRRRALQSLSPYWGGSLEEQRQVAVDAQRFAEANPRLRILPGFVEVEAADIDWRAQRYKEAGRGYRRALAYGAVPEWYGGVAACQAQMGLWVKVVETSEEWMAELGDNALARRWRGQARTALGDFKGALADLDQAHAWMPQDAYILRLRAEARRLAGSPREAADDLRLSLELDPGDAWTIEQLRGLEAATARTARVETTAPGATSAAQPQGARKLPALSRLGLQPAKQ